MSINWSQVFSGVVVGIILGFGSMFMIMNGKIERMDEQIKQLKEAKLVITEEIPDGTGRDGHVKPMPEKLIEIIKEKQRQNVKPGNSENDCFTDEDLSKFIKGKKQDMIVSDLMKDNSFIELVIVIKEMTPTKRQELLDLCAETAKPTWDDLGKISAEGQTKAGNEAEILIAKALSDKVREMTKLSVGEIKEYYE